MIKKSLSSRQEKTARYARALSHPVRIYILELLADQACCYSGDLADDLPVARSTLSQHLKALRDAGLIQGEINSPKIKYCLNGEAWEEARQLLGSLFLQDHALEKAKY